MKSPLIFVSLLYFFGASPALAITFDIEFVSPGGGIPSFVYDDNGTPHIASFGNYATHDNGFWNVSTFHQPSHRESIGIDPNGQPVIAYTNYEEIGIAQKVSDGSWIKTKIDAGKFIHPSMQVKAGKYHLAYWDQDAGSLKYASSMDGNTWTVETLDDDGLTGVWPNVQVHDDGKVLIAYTSADSSGQPAMVKLASKDNAGWSISNVDDVSESGTETWPSLEIDSFGRVHIVYAGSEDALWYAVFINNAWEKQKFFYRGVISDLLLLNDLPIVALRHTSQDDLYLAYLVDIWKYEIVDSNLTSAYAKLDLFEDKIGLAYTKDYRGASQIYFTEFQLNGEPFTTEIPEPSTIVLITFGMLLISTTLKSGPSYRK